MYLDDLDSLPEKIKTGKLSAAKAKIEILTVVYTNPGRFGLQKMNEDDRSDFLLKVFDRLDGLLKAYKSDVSPFGAYIFKCIRCYKLSWRKEKHKKNVVIEALQPDVIHEYMLKNDGNCDKNLEIAEKKPTYSTKNPKLIFHRIFETPSHHNIKKSEKVINRAVLVLALKSAWYITDEQINSVCIMCGCNPEVLSKIINSLKESLDDKALVHEELQSKRDTAYYFLRSYKRQLEDSSMDTHQRQELKRKFLYQNRNWMKKNEILRNCRKKIVPTNSQIGEILGIDEKQVSMCLTAAKRKGLFLDSGD